MQSMTLSLSDAFTLQQFQDQDLKPANCLNFAYIFLQYQATARKTKHLQNAYCAQLSNPTHPLYLTQDECLSNFLTNFRQNENRQSRFLRCLKAVGFVYRFVLKRSYKDYFRHLESFDCIEFRSTSPCSLDIWDTTATDSHFTGTFLI